MNSSSQFLAKHSIFGMPLTILIVLAYLSCSLQAQLPSSSKKSLLVDEVITSDGKRFYGIILKNTNRDGLTMMIRRDWLEKTHPEFYRTHLTNESQTEIQAMTKHLFRLEAWWKSRKDNPELVTFVDREMERVEKQREARQKNQATELQPFTLLNFPTTQLRKIYQQTPDRHHMAGIAWKHDIDRVTSRSIKAIQRDLESKNIDWKQESFDLSDKLTISQEQSEEQWRARIALIEYQLCQPLDFQGTGSLLVRIEPNQANLMPGDINAMLKQLMNANMQSDLSSLMKGNPLFNELGIGNKFKNNQPEQESNWWQDAAKIAESEQINGFLTARVSNQTTGNDARVELCFFAFIKPGKWKEVIKIESRVSYKDVDAAEVDRINNDPQIKGLLDITRGLGLGSGDMINKALRHGAATKLALEESKDKFYSFLDRHIKRSDSPPLEIQ
ncbi:MAG: hypothetical protein ACPIA2_05250 [Mariniblastus sp.]